MTVPRSSDGDGGRGWGVGLQDADNERLSVNYFDYNLYELVQEFIEHPHTFFILPIKRLFYQDLLLELTTRI